MVRSYLHDCVDKIGFYMDMRRQGFYLDKKICIKNNRE